MEQQTPISIDNKGTFISSIEASGKYGFTNDYITSLCRRKKVQGILVGRLWFVEEESLKKYIEEAKEKKEQRNEALSESFKESHKVGDVVHQRSVLLFSNKIRATFGIVICGLIAAVFLATLARPARAAEITLDTLFANTYNTAQSIFFGVRGVSMPEIHPVELDKDVPKFEDAIHQLSYYAQTLIDFAKGPNTAAQTAAVAIPPAPKKVAISTPAILKSTIIKSAKAATTVKVVTTPQVTTASLDARFTLLAKQLQEQISNSITSKINEQTAGLWQAIALTNKIDKLDNVTITNSTINNVSTFGASGDFLPLSGGTLTGALVFTSATGTSLIFNNATGTTLALTSQGSGCAQFDSQGHLTSNGTACGTGTGAGFPFTATTNFGVAVNSTSTPIWFQSGLFASSTSVIGTTTFAANGNVGIGTSTPTSLFSINPINGAPNMLMSIGSSTGSIFTVDAAGTTTVNTLRFGDTGLNGFFWKMRENTSNNLVIEYPGAVRNILLNPGDASGNVGIGTTSPFAQLSVNPNGISGPSFYVGSTTQTQFIITNAGNIGIGTSSPYAKLSILASSSDMNAYLFAIASSSTATTTSLMTVSNSGVVSIGADYSNLFSVDAITGSTTIANLSIGNLNFDTNAGVVSLANIPVDSNASAGTQESESLQIGDIAILTVYAEANGIGSIRNTAVGIGTTSPTQGLFTILASTLASSTSNNILNIASSTAAGTTTSFMIMTNTGLTGFGSSSPSALVSIHAGSTTLLASGNLFAVGSTSSSGAFSTIFSISATGSTSLGLFGSCSGSSALTTNAAGAIACGAITAAGSFPYTPTTNFGFAVNSTSTPIFFTKGMMASSTSLFDAIAARNGLQIGSSTNPVALFDIFAASTSATTTLFSIASTSNTGAVTQIFSISNTGVLFLNGGTGNGTLGIGTNAPTQIIDIVNNGQTNGVLQRNTNGNTVWLLRSTEPGGSGGTLFLASAGVTRTQITGASNIPSFFMGTTSVGSTSPYATFSIQQNASNTQTTLFAVSSSTAGLATSTFFVINNIGQVLIGTSSIATTTTLVVQGANTTGAVVAAFTNGTGTCSIDPTGTALSCSSDIRLKKDINALASSSLSAVRSLRAVNYHWLTEQATSSLHTGFIAQEVQEIFPDLVRSDYNGMLAVNYAGFTPYLTGALQELDLNLQTIASTTASSTPESQGFADSFFSNVFKRISTWLADAGNGIASLFVKEVHTDKLCVGETCVTKEQFLEMVNSSVHGGASSAASAASSEPEAPADAPAQDEPADAPETSADAPADSTPPADEPVADTPAPETPAPAPESTPTPEEAPAPAPQPEAAP